MQYRSRQRKREKAPETAKDRKERLRKYYCSLRAAKDDDRPPWFYGTPVYRSGTATGSPTFDPDELKPGFEGRILRLSDGRYEVWKYTAKNDTYLSKGTRKDAHTALRALIKLD